MPNTAVDGAAGTGWLHVAAAVVRRADGHILLAQRPLHKHQGGKWEFPGGKLEPSETVQQALSRELQEEIGITPLQATPLIQVRHTYVERRVLLDVWEVTAYSGEAHGREGQPVAWYPASALSSLPLPSANWPIAVAAALPDLCLVTPEPTDPTAFLQGLERALQRGIRLVQFRAKTLDAAAYLALAQAAIALAHRYGAKLLLNSLPANAAPALLAMADGLHLTSAQLRATPERAALPLQPRQWLSAACHDAQELALAAQLGVDFAFLSPVLPTASHPAVQPLGWSTFNRLVRQVNFPVYALGGLAEADVASARQHGARGVAAIRSLWG